MHYNFYWKKNIYPKILCIGLLSKSSSLMLNCLKYARKMLSSRKCAPIDDFIRADILPLLIDFLSPNYDNQYV